MGRLAMEYQQNYSDHNLKLLKGDGYNEEDYMFDSQGLHLKKLGELKKKDKNNGGCSCYYS